MEHQATCLIHCWASFICSLINLLYLNLGSKQSYLKFCRNCMRNFKDGRALCHFIGWDLINQTKKYIGQMNQIQARFMWSGQNQVKMGVPISYSKVTNPIKKGVIWASVVLINWIQQPLWKMEIPSKFKLFAC